MLGSTRAVCELNPCQNGGTCKPQETGTRKYSCECPSGEYTIPIPLIPAF